VTFLVALDFSPPAFKNPSRDLELDWANSFPRYFSSLEKSECAHKDVPEMAGVEGANSP
jgi:hypothetical protein